MKLGFIGTGAMGLPMMRNLLAKGFAVTAYDANATALDAAAAAGAKRAVSCADVARASEGIVTILPSASNVQAAYLGASGILEAGAKATSCIDMSTIDPASSRQVAGRLAERGVRYID